jgi:hypothetical protein
MSDLEKAPEDRQQSLGIREPPADDVPPNGGYGWVCTACVALINAHTWGTLLSSSPDSHVGTD